MAFQLVIVFTLFVTTAMAVNPKLPLQFQMQWRMVATINNNISIPLDWNPLPPKGVQYLVGSGSTYYDWDRKAMLEIYDDFCVPIFGPLGDRTNLFKCNFLNVNLTSYLISEPPSPFPSCCVFGSQVFHPPAPDFLKHMNFNSAGQLFDKQVDWWVLDTNTDDPAEPFGYGFYKNINPETKIRDPAAFWFRTVNGFTVQYFRKFEIKTPNQSTWDLPKICINAPSCGYL